MMVSFYTLTVRAYAFMQLIRRLSQLIYCSILVTYATREEALEAVKLTNDYNQPRKMMLDVYAPVQKPPGLRPVLVSGGRYICLGLTFKLILLLWHRSTFTVEHGGMALRIWYIHMRMI